MKQDNFRGIIFFASLLVITFLLFSCEQVFDYSIYSAKVDTKDKDIRKTNFEKLKPLQDNMTDTSSFSIALLSDSHTYYDELSSTVDQINTEKGISFVLHGGDMTDGGILAEYRLFRAASLSFSTMWFGKRTTPSLILAGWQNNCYQKMNSDMCLLLPTFRPGTISLPHSTAWPMKPCSTRPKLIYPSTGTCTLLTIPPMAMQKTLNT
jgi:calcineurin-like phosphoesterase family protein